MQLVLISLLVMLHLQGIDPAAFRSRVAELDSIAAQGKAATSPEARAQAALRWLRALQHVLEITPSDRVAGPHVAWLKANADLVVFDEPGGAWRIRVAALNRIYGEHAGTSAAEEIAWLGATNFLPGECEGDHACYLRGLNVLQGEYLRRYPGGPHRGQALERITAVLRIQVTDLPTASAPAVGFDSARDCDGVLRSLRPLRAAVAGTGAAGNEAMALIDRMIKACP